MASEVTDNPNPAGASMISAVMVSAISSLPKKTTVSAEKLRFLRRQNGVRR